MKKQYLFLLPVLFAFCSVKAFSQSAATGQICFIRATGYVASAVNFRVFIDDSLACKLKNKRYSLHTVSAGEHTVSAQNMGISLDKKSAPFKVLVAEGKITYINLVWANEVSCQEITANSAEQSLKKIKQTTDCGSKTN
ncbi:hypothetical protein [Deminuibacter soli]|uniref:DUF2846 domain-containing protein n=1 Tax=Deminuibacter soli TaxID=2291815 RepID=A0A3E1NG96_9BACT|nr:hypothetical protein [Deminuibacter soli]RFM26907.1 hypothetical protein DXN05_18145 [Deminuibacter soli]